MFFFKSTRNISKSAEIIAEKASFFLSSPSALVSFYQFVQHRRQYLSKFIITYSKIVSLCQSFSAPSELISNCLSLSVRTAQCVSLCQTFSVMSVQYQYLSMFVSEKGESQCFSGLVVLGTYTCFEIHMIGGIIQTLFTNFEFKVVQSSLEHSYLCYDNINMM